MKIFDYINPKALFITVFTVFLSCIIYFFSAKFLEQNAFDFMMKLSANKAGSNEIINIVIDDKSIEEVDSWPWERKYYTDIFRFLNLAEAKVIAFDAVLTMDDKNNNNTEFLSRLSKIENLVAGVEFAKEENPDNPGEDVRAEEFEYFTENLAINVVDNRKSEYIRASEYSSYNKMFPKYIDTLKNIGAVNTAVSDDGAIRTFEPIILMQGKYYPSLPLAIYLQLKDIKEIVLYDDEYRLIAQDGTITSFPLFFDNNKSVQYIKWLAPFNKTSWVAHEQVKASDIVKSYKNLKEDKDPIIPLEKFKNKIVVIGATANALEDLKVTPVTINMPGSTIQAEIIDNLISNDSIHIANVFENVIIMLIFMAAIVVLALFVIPFISVISVLLLAFLYFYIVLFAYSNGFILNVITPYIFFALTSIAVYIYKFTVEDTKKEILKSAMKKYVNTSVVDNLMKNADGEVELGGRKSEVTILMADIRGFTHFSENIDPSEVTLLLNEYFGQMLPIIEEFGGCVNKFIGDAILAVFNEPIKDRRHPINAILCANKMLEAVRELKKKWKEENKPEIDISIGINTGMVFIGNVGTPNHMEYTVIGDTVNVASRIEAQNRQFNTQILISETTYEYAKDILDVIKISSVEIRGREKHMDIYEIINILDNNETN